MKRFWIVLTGMAALAPVASLIAIPILWTDPPPGNYDAARAHADAFHNLAIGLITLFYLVTGFFMVLAFRSSAVPAGKRGLWAALLFFGNALVLPFFWYWYIWRGRASKSVEVTPGT